MPNLPWIGFAAPLAIIGGFALWGHNQGFAKRSDTRQRFADSCYFLGFLLTMMAMLAGFMPAGLLNETITSKQILQHFSMALGATALGLICRIIVLQTTTSISEDSAQVEADLKHFATQIRAEASEIRELLVQAKNEFRSQQQASMKFLGTELPTRAEQALGKVGIGAEQIAQRMAEQATILQNTVGQLSSSLERDDTRIAAIQELTERSRENVSAGIEELALQLAALNGSLGVLSGQLSQSVSGATEQIEQTAVAFQNMQSLAPALAPAVESLNSQLTGLTNEAASVATASSEFVQLVEHSRITIEGLPEKVLAFSEPAAAAMEQAAEKVTADLIERSNLAITNTQAELVRSLKERIEETSGLADGIRLRASDFETSLEGAIKELVLVVSRFETELVSVRDRIGTK